MTATAPEVSDRSAARDAAQAVWPVFIAPVALLILAAVIVLALSIGADARAAACHRRLRVGMPLETVQTVCQDLDAKVSPCPPGEICSSVVLTLHGGLSIVDIPVELVERRVSRVGRARLVD